MKKRLEVVGAAIVDGGRVLAAQRKESQYPHSSLKWELPGGKTEAGETKESAIKREIREELGCEIRPIKELVHIIHEYRDFILDMTVIMCELKAGEKPECLEHNRIMWCAGGELRKLDWAEADRKALSELENILG